ncbi:hypothetical protein PAL_GLEAN10016636 [Pteropus alecto]|uniref:Uncharacterized protein n=1 Tax=Pteropus alecto TaxID=9402 RepID=L5L2P2_PTEAL|nr:hypothetical protein PAL_GLEAN10016636 [Pteropus alecto]
MVESCVGPPEVFCPQRTASRFLGFTLRSSHHALQKTEGREHLRRLLNWEEFDELRDARRSILLDTLYESIIFAVGKGFPWVEVAKVVKFTEELIKETKGCSITEAVTILGNKLRDYQGQFNTTHLLALCDYFHNTFIRHYKLYQYVLGQDQEVNLTVIHLEVCLPPQPLPLSAGMDRELWKHEQQVAELSMAEVQKRTNVLLLKETLHLEQEHMLQKKFSEVLAQHTQVLKRESHVHQGLGGMMKDGLGMGTAQGRRCDKVGKGVETVILEESGVRI